MRKRNIIPYDPGLKQLARDLRNNSTLSEILLWKKIKGKQMRGYDFHRQKPLNKFIVDFFCHELMLSIEIDGSSHNDKAGYDEERQKKLESLGVSFLRFHDGDVKFRIDDVLNNIEEWIIEFERTHHSPSEESSLMCEKLNRR